MSARSGLVGKESSWPYLGPPEAIFPLTGKILKMPKFCLFSLVGQWAMAALPMAAIHGTLQSTATKCRMVLICCSSFGSTPDFTEVSDETKASISMSLDLGVLVQPNGPPWKIGKMLPIF